MAFEKLLNHNNSSKKKRRARRGEAARWLDDHVDYDGDECLEWPFYRDPNGYGRIGRGKDNITASHAMCEKKRGPRPGPVRLFQAAHSCGNGHLGCVNPNHLDWKTAKQNQADRIRHGTSFAGIRKPGTRIFTAAEVAYIKTQRGKKFQHEIAAQFGVSQGRICLIQNDKGD